MYSFVYYMVFSLLNIFDVYIVFSFMKIFLKGNYLSQKLIIICYSLYYIATSIIYIFVSSFILNLISSSILVFLITLSYKSRMSTKIIATLLAILTFFTAELIVGLLIGVCNVDPLQHTYYGSEFSLILVEILKYIIVKIIGKFKNINTDISIPLSFLITVILVPTISIFFEIQLLMQENVSEIIYILSLVCLLMLNFTVFYLYDSISDLFTEKIHSAMARQESKFYRKEAKLIQEQSQKVRQLRHDMKNHLIALEGLAKANDNIELINYVVTLSGMLEPSAEFSSTGIISLDSVINYKCSQAKENGSSIFTDIAIPNDLKIDENDFVAMIGNLLDNAIEATSKLKENKYIKLNIKYSKGIIIIAVINSFDGDIILANNKYQTTKKNKDFHGSGLQSIETIVYKYNGEMITKHSNHEFYTKIILIL